MPSKAIYVAVAMMFSANVFAGGAATGGATEVTQIMNNGELISSVSKQSQMVAGQLKDYALQTQKYMTMLQNLKNLPNAKIQDALVPYQQTLGTIGKVYDATMDVYRTSTQAQQVYDRRIAEMRMLKMDPQQYLLNEIALAKVKGGIYQQKLDSDRVALQVAQSKSMKLASMQDQVTSISGNVEGLQVLAQQNQMMAGELLELNTNLRQETAEKNADGVRQQEDKERQELAEQQATAAAAARNAKVKDAITGGKAQYGF